jgi:DnaJ-class molecular chaperone
VEKRINVEIPAGVEEGARLRLKNQGPKGRGDLIVEIRVAPDRFFRREGLDLIGVVPINLAQALLGSRIKVKTLDDKRVVLRIPAGTQHGQKFRIPAHGIEKNGRRGDMYVEAHVTIPEKLSAEEQEAVKSLRKDGIVSALRCQQHLPDVAAFVDVPVRCGRVRERIHSIDTRRDFPLARITEQRFHLRGEERLL